MIRHIVKREPPAWLLVTAIIFFVVLLSASGALWLFDSANKGKVFPGVYVGQLSLGGKSEEEAFALINQAIDNYRQNGITFAYNGHRQVLPLEIAGESSENSQALIDFNVDKMTARALGYGRDADILTNAFHQLNALTSKHYIAPSYALNEASIKKYLVDSFQKDIQIGEPAKISFADNRFKITPEKPGYSLDFSTVFDPLENLVSRLETGEITISITKSLPSLTSDQLGSLIEKANAYLDKAPLNLNYQKKKWAVKREALGTWLAIASDGQSQGISLNKTEVLAYLDKNVAPDIEIKVTDSKFLMKNGKAVAFSTAKDGLLIDATTTLAKIENDWLASNLSSTSIAMMKVASQSSTTGSNDLGITELIGVGTSNFAGSPANRRHNIKIGMSYLNGLLIKPGETFSVMRHLGTIDGSKGYLEELVIKKDKTQKEFGGGLCQVGTTMFRAALNSGLPITERRNHSYRVAYYEPAGTDATIYDPAPDLKFVNDTGNYVLIQGYITGSKLVFEFWGTKDGRKATQTYPKITNIVKPKPAKLIETLDLKPGQKKCTEKAHNGADASFFYSVTYPNGEVKSKTFNSHYVPWQEVCLIGVSKLSPATNSTSTDASAPAMPSTTTSTPTTPTIKTNATSTTKTETPVAIKEPITGAAGNQTTASSTAN
jgi:vancomycin resistance protein YoaR